MKCGSEKTVRHILYPVDGGSMSLSNIRTYVHKKVLSKGGVLGQTN